MKTTQPDKAPHYTRSLRALVLEDNREDVERMEALLRGVGYILSLEVVNSLAHFQKQLAQADYDIILADYNLRAGTAIDALAVLRKSGKEVPLVVVAGASGDLAAVECLKQGAADYVLKHRLQRLPVVVERLLRDKAYREEAARLQEQIHSAQEEWELTFDVVPDPIFQVDRRHRIQRVNRAAAALLGLKRSELIGRSCHEVLHDRADPVPGCPVERMLMTGKEERGDIEVALLGKVFDATASPLFDSHGVVRGAVHVLRDITERKREEEALRRSEASYRSLILGATYGIFRCDQDGRFLAVNPALVAMLAYESEADLLAANVVRNVTRDAEEGAQLLQQYRQRGRVDGIEAQWRRKDGTLIPVRLSGRTVLDVHGAWQGFEVLAENVSERWHLEDQLRQAQKMEAVGRLAGGVAHDFNNLLTIVSGYSDLLLEKPEAAATMRGYLEEIKKAADRGGTLVRQLLAFSRRQVLVPRVLDLNAVVANIDRMLRRLIGENIELTTLNEPRLEPVKADPGQIEQVILNLAVNARDAMPEGGQLTLETANVDLDEDYTRSHVNVVPGRYVMLAVSDSGVGMDAETQAHLYEPFFTTKKEGQGTGLGLATVYGIVNQSGGHICVYSEPGQGTTFKVYLPAAPRMETAAAESTPTRRCLPCGSETILLVEDEEGVRTLADRILRLRGYKVIAAANPTEASQLCERHEGPIHLLLTDVIMPTMSGRRLAEHLSLMRPELRVLYMSGYTDRAVVPRGILEEGAPFLQKPFTPESLARKIREVLETPQPPLPRRRRKES
ncbi:MAG: response regulator [Acidobacteriia bacterium]|nr:response regulator [Terriglobia bacterium]